MSYHNNQKLSDLLNVSKALGSVTALRKETIIIMTK